MGGKAIVKEMVSLYWNISGCDTVKVFFATSHKLFFLVFHHAGAQATMAWPSG